MKPDVYKGGDAAAVKSVAKSIVMKDQPKAKILRMHITSSNWAVEDVVEWTDTTKSSVQRRITKGLYVQAALKNSDACFLYALFVHKDNVGSKAGLLTGHIMYKDKYLEQILPK